MISYLVCASQAALRQSFPAVVEQPRRHLYTLRQSVIVRPMHPSPATSTTFSCQLNRTLMPAPADSFAAPGRPPTWLNPVAWGVTLVGVRGALPPDDDAMPLYLIKEGKKPMSAQIHVNSCVEGICRRRHCRMGTNAQILHEHIQQLATAVALVYALEHGRHLARLDRLEDLDNGLEVCILRFSRVNKSSRHIPSAVPHTACLFRLGPPFPKSPLLPAFEGTGGMSRAGSYLC